MATAAANTAPPIQQLTDVELLAFVSHYRAMRLSPISSHSNGEDAMLALMAQLILDNRNRLRLLQESISPVIDSLASAIDKLDIKSFLPGFDMFGNFPPDMTKVNNSGAANVNGSAGTAVNNERPQDVNSSPDGNAPVVDVPTLSDEEVKEQVESDKTHPTQEEQERASAAAATDRPVSKTRNEPE